MIVEKLGLSRQRILLLRQMIRFYQAAVVNTAFGFGLFALLIWFGTNRFAAQIVAQLCGMGFNYFTYSRHVFRDSSGGKARFVAAYGVNYIINLCLLALTSMFVRSAYLAGLIATVSASLINYLALKHLVFARRTPS